MDFAEFDEKIIHDMCLTMRHDYGLLSAVDKSGTRNLAEQLYMNCISRHIAERDESIFKLRTGKKQLREEIKKRNAEIEHLKKALEDKKHQVKQEEGKDERVRKQLEYVLAKKDGIIEYLEKKLAMVMSK